MKIIGVGAIAALALGGCATATAGPPVEVGTVALCQDYQGRRDQERATQSFGSCLSMADRLAAARKPTATVPDTTHWDMPVMQGFIAGTTHGASGG